MLHMHIPSAFPRHGVKWAEAAHALVTLAVLLHTIYAKQIHACNSNTAILHVPPPYGDCREDVAANRIVGDPAFRRKLLSAAAAAPPASTARAGDLSAQKCQTCSQPVVAAVLLLCCAAVAAKLAGSTGMHTKNWSCHLSNHDP